MITSELFLPEGAGLVVEELEIAEKKVVLKV